MTEAQPPAGDSTPEPVPAADQTADESGSDATASARAREWLGQLEAMIQNVAHEAVPAAREVGAKAAELAAAAAVKAGPAAQKAAAVTAEYGQRFAEKAHTAAADWRQGNENARAAEASEATAEEPEQLPPSTTEG